MRINLTILLLLLLILNLSLCLFVSSAHSQNTSVHREVHSAIVETLKEETNKYCFGQDIRIQRKGQIERTGQEFTQPKHKVYCGQKYKQLVYAYNFGGATVNYGGVTFLGSPIGFEFTKDNEGRDYEADDTALYLEEDGVKLLPAMPGKYEVRLHEKKNDCHGWELTIGGHQITSTTGVLNRRHDFILDVDGWIVPTSFKASPDNCRTLFFAVEIYRLKVSE